MNTDGCLQLTVTRRGEGLRLTCGLVCSTGRSRYLRVEPRQLFLMPGNNFTDSVLVTANVEWKVK